ncbi:MAG: energy transducer TonB [Methylobacter sp.]|nr:energy transducer TonB [Methylobacter sp.]
MYLLNSHEGALADRNFTTLGSTRTPRRALLEALRGDESSFSIGGLFFILVLLLHGWAAYGLMKPIEPVTPAKPLIIKASLVTVPNQRQASVTPPAPPKQVQPKKQPVKQPVKKTKPVIRKPAELPKPKPVTKQPLPMPSLSESKPESASSAVTNTAAPLSNTKTNTEPFTEANFRANYGFNPKPKYPTVARNRGWEGKVLLKVRVSAEGHSDEVTLHTSSGHEALDESAIEAVKKWRFIPAKRGETEVASSVIVPINFTLNN